MEPEFTVESLHIMKRRLLIIPIENKSREIPGKLLLSAKAAEEKYFVILGEKKVIRKLIPKMLIGIYAEISIPEHKYEKFLKPYTNLGYKIVNICEECVNYFDSKDYCNRKIGINSLKTTSLFFGLGKRHVEDVKSNRDVLKDQMPITGNYRFDLLRKGCREVYRNNAIHIKEKYGNFVLFNLNFARCNPHPDRVNRLNELIEKNMITTEKQVEIWNESKKYKEKIMHEFMKFMPKITSSLNCKVIIRPHPSENHNFWENWSRNRKNIKVVYEGSASEWMMAANAVIHA
jgi:surface carbohydrate biosynthesis protein